MNKYLSHILICIISISSQSLRANEKITELVESISKEQIRIDKLDKIQDRAVTLKSEIQSKQATDIYLNLSEKIVSNITMNVMLSDDLKISQLKTIQQILTDVGSKNIHLYTQFSPDFNLIIKIQEINNPSRLKNILNSTFIDFKNFILNFYIIKPLFKKFL